MFLSIIIFKKNYFRNTIRVSNSFNHSPSPYCLQRLSAGDKNVASKERALKIEIREIYFYTCIFIWRGLSSDILAKKNEVYSNDGKKNQISI